MRINTYSSSLKSSKFKVVGIFHLQKSFSKIKKYMVHIYTLHEGRMKKKESTLPLKNTDTQDIPHNSTHYQRI